MTVDELIAKYNLDRSSKDFGFDLMGAWIEECVKPRMVDYIERENVTNARNNAPGGAVKSVTPIARSVTVIDQAGNAIPDHPGYAPRGKTWCKCEHCRTWFLSSRHHAKTCKSACRKALSRKTS